MMSNSNQRGLTLIELMVALLISLLILAGLFTVYRSNQHGYRLNDGLVRIQESGRFAIDYLSRDIRQTAYPNGELNPKVIPTPEFHLFLFNNGADNIDVVNSNPGQFPPSDVLAIRHGIQNQLTTDCNGVAPDGAGTGGNADANPGTNGWTTLNVYAIQDTGRTNIQGNPILGLFCNGNELVEGVENMQVLYGVDTDPSLNSRDYVADQYFDFTTVPNINGDAIPDWNRVVSLRIALLASSVDEKATQPSGRSFNLLGDIIGPFDGTGVDVNGVAIPADQKMRRIYTTTILIRNNMAQ